MPRALLLFADLNVGIFAICYRNFIYRRCNYFVGSKPMLQLYENAAFRPAVDKFFAPELMPAGREY
jgi:hypothetical protein